jgi:GTP cyclohydrolase I
MESHSEEGQECRNTLPDCAAEADSRALSIQEVGICELSYPISVWDRAGRLQHTVAQIQLAVGLPSHFKGTHMSRFVEVLGDFRGELSLATAPELLAALQRRLESDDAHLQVSFPYFMSRKAPVSGAESLMEYCCQFKASRSGEDLDFVLCVDVPVTTLCPCSKAISKYGAHSQRSVVKVELRFDEMVWIEEVVEAVEACASAPLYALLKREDEKWVTEHAYENPRFVEDLVREVLLALRALPGVTWLQVRAENMETIHKHQAYAVIGWPEEEPVKVAPSAAPQPGLSSGAWMRQQRKLRGESQQRLSEAIGVSKSLLSRVESGERVLSEDALGRLAARWGMPAETVMLRSGVLSKRLKEQIQARPEAFMLWANPA